MKDSPGKKSVFLKKIKPVVMKKSINIALMVSVFIICSCNETNTNSTQTGTTSETIAEGGQGSVKDEEVFATARQLGVGMAITGQRHFRH